MENEEKNSWIRNFISKLKKKPKVKEKTLRERIKEQLKVTYIPAGEKKITPKEDDLIKSLLRNYKGEGPIPPVDNK